MSNNKQTAVEWLFYQLWDEPKDKFTWYAILKQAKEIEKQQQGDYAKKIWENACKAQMELVYEHCMYSPEGTNGNAIKHWVKQAEFAEQYYNEEYGNYQNENPKCIFESSNTNSSATICKWCGKEKWQHNEEYGKQ